MPVRAARSIRVAEGRAVRSPPALMPVLAWSTYAARALRVQTVAIVHRCCRLLLLGITGGASAQSAVDGAIGGHVVDAHGSAVPGAKVALSNAATGVGSVLRSGADGAFLAVRVAPGEYTVTITAPGFESLVEAATVELGATASVEAQLRVGHVESTVTVNAQVAEEVGQRARSRVRRERAGDAAARWAALAELRAADAGRERGWAGRRRGGGELSRHRDHAEQQPDRWGLERPELWRGSGGDGCGARVRRPRRRRTRAAGRAWAAMARGR